MEKVVRRSRRVQNSPAVDVDVRCRSFWRAGDPRSREVGYCCVLGALGEIFALCVYLGAEGLAGYGKMQARGMGRELEDLPFTQKCLMASFEDRERLHKEDRDIIKKLGLKFRGRDSWPLFRSHMPGYFPWCMTKDEALFLTAALQQATDVVKRFKENGDLLTPPEDDLVFTRIPSTEGKGRTWRDDWVRPDAFEREEPELPPVETERLDRILRSSSGSQTAWEVDFFLFPRSRQGGRATVLPYDVPGDGPPERSGPRYLVGSPLGSSSPSAVKGSSTSWSGLRCSRAESSSVAKTQRPCSNLSPRPCASRCGWSRPWGK